MQEDKFSWGIYAGTGAAFVGVLVYLVVHIVGLVKLARSKDTEPISGLSIAAWVLSFVGGFMGPCVILASIGALIMGVMALRAEPSERTAICARNALAAGGTIIVMVLVMLAFILPSLPE